MDTLFHFVVLFLISCLSGTKVRIYFQQTSPAAVFPLPEECFRHFIALFPRPAAGTVAQSELFSYLCPRKRAVRRPVRGPIASWSEQRTHNPKVVGSCPSGSTRRTVANSRGRFSFVRAVRRRGVFRILPGLAVPIFFVFLYLNTVCYGYQPKPQFEESALRALHCGL